MTMTMRATSPPVKMRAKASKRKRMVILKKPAKKIQGLVGTQGIVNGVHYRPSQYTHVVEVDGNTVACSGITRCIAQITDAEAEMLSKGVSSPVGAEELIKNWFLVPDDHDDYALCSETRNLLRIFAASSKNRRYTIMTTLDCNARCFYCYQMGRNKNRNPMSAETANAVADYIINDSIGGKADIQWYGGEPLYNDEVIDIISNRLKDAGVEYTSTMISNGYLLSKEKLEKAVNLWKLGKIQIPLDGTEAVYNSVKAYIHKDVESPYRVVMDNIKNALDNGIRIVIRVNFDQHNTEDIFKLANELKDNFVSYSNFAIYSDILYENAGTKSPVRAAEERMQLVNNMIKFENYCMENGLLVPRAMKDHMKSRRCMADMENTVVISPDGRVGKCDHRMESKTHTSVFSNEIDTDMVESFKEELNCKEMCQKCPMLHNCIRLVGCPDDGDSICDDAYKKKKEHCFLISLKNEYRKIIKKGNM